MSTTGIQIGQKSPFRLNFFFAFQRVYNGLTPSSQSQRL